MLIVVALGGNALLKRGEPMTAAVQRGNVARAAGALAELARAGHRLVITHGNGPQIGLLALQAAAGPSDGAYPLDVLGAESEGMIGYLIEQELNNQLPGATIATLLTQVRVDSADPAFGNPSKPIGPVYDAATARGLAADRGWRIAADGDKWRRVVASPEPLEILELPVIAFLIEHGVIVICGGGGGIPVVRRSGGDLIGIEAVVDKDKASALLARQIKADVLLLLTDVDAAYVGYGTPGQRAIARVGSNAIGLDQFPAGSMRPKIEAAASFAEYGGRAAIGRLEDATAIIRGEAGTTIEKGSAPIRFR